MATLGYLGEKLDLQIKQGSTFGPFTVTVKAPDETPIDLSQVVVRGHLRQSNTSTDFISFDVIKTDPVNGVFEFSLSAQITAGLNAGPTIHSIESQYVYDIELDSGAGVVTPFLFGVARVFREVTK